MKVLLGYSVTVYSGCYTKDEYTIKGPIEVLNIKDYGLPIINSFRVVKNSDNPDYTGISTYIEENYRGFEHVYTLGEFKCDYW